MSAIRLYGDTSGYTEIAAQSVAGNNSITLPLGGGTLVTSLSGTASTASFATTSFGLSGSPNIAVGIATASSFVGNLTGTATGLSGSPSITVNNIVGVAATFSGNVSIAGTLTYEDVTNVDSVGLVTARSGVRVSGGGLIVVGVTTVAAGSTSAPSITPTGDENTGVFFPAADTIAFAEGGAESARFNSSGNLIVGTTSDTGTASQRLQVTGGGYFSGNVGFGITNPTTSLHYYRVGGTNLRLESDANTNPNEISLRTPAGRTARIVSAYTNPAATTETYLAFHTNVTGSSNDTVSESLRIVGGNVGMGITNPSEFIHIQKFGSDNFLRIDAGGTSSNRSGIKLFEHNILYGWEIAHDAGSDLLQISHNASSSVYSPTPRVTFNPNGNVGIANTTPSERLHVTGNILASGNVTGYSDETLKDNIQTIPDALDKVTQLRGVEFDRKDIEGNPHQIGVIAQEVEKVIPEVVMTNEDGIKSVAYGNLVGLLIEAIKELKEEVNELKARLEEV